LISESYLIFLGAGEYQLHAIKCAKELGINTIAFDADPEAVGFNFSDKFFNIDFFNNEESVFNQLKINGFNLIGVMSYCNEKGMRLASKIREKYNLKGINNTVTENMVNKYFQRKIWSTHNLPCPKWRLINNQKINVEELENYLSYPLIVKPIDSGGSRGVVKVINRNELFSAIAYAREFSTDEKVIVEEYFSGKEFTVETITVDNITTVLAITSKEKVPNTNNIVANQLESLDRKNKLYSELGKLAINALRTLSYNNGPGHTEILYNEDSNQKILVETAGRGAGFKIFESLVPKISGYNVTKNIILQSIGMKVDSPKNILHNYGIIKYFTDNQGTVKSISGFDSIRKYNSEQVSIEGSSFVSIGDEIQNPTTDGDRLGYLLGWGKDKDQVKNIFMKEFEKINFEIIYH